MDRDNADLDNLRRIVRDVDPVPDEVFAAARAAIITRELDAQLAALVADSAAMEDELRFDPVRTAASAEAADTRLLSFDGGGVRVELEVSGQADQLTVVGQLVGAADRDCVLEQADGHVHHVELDSIGRFLITGVTSGPARLRYRSESGGRVSTPWVWL
jgi:hypothetical protein